MPVRCCLPALLAVLVLSAGSARAEVADPAELLPADTLLYVEVTDPGKVADQLGPLLKGSALEDVVAFVDRLRAKLPAQNPYMDPSEFGLIGTLLGPEMRAEAKRFRGLAFAVTGFDKRHHPETVAILLSGESQVPGIAMRVFLTTSPTLRKVATVEGVAIYQDAFVNPVIVDGAFPPGGLPAPPEEGSARTMSGPAYASLPGVVLVGSGKESVAAAIRRLKGKEKSPTLVQLPAFRERAALRKQPGLFGYANPEALCARMDDAIRASNQRIDSNEWAVFKEVLNPKALRSVTAHLSLAGGGLELRVQARLDPKLKSPLAELFANQKARPDSLAVSPKDAWLALSISLPEPGQRLARLLAVGDAVVRGTGSLGPTPTEAVRELEQERKIDLAKNIGTKLNGITILLPTPGTNGAEAPGLPTLVLHTDDAATAQAVESLLPALFGVLGAEAGEPVTETVGGAKVRSLAASAVPWKTPVHFGRMGNAFVIGPDRKAVAAVLTADKAKGLAADPRIAPALKKADGAAAVAVVQWAGLFPPPKEASPGPGSPRAPGRGIRVVEELPFELQPALAGVLDAKLWQELLAALRGLPPVVVAVERQADSLRVELRQRDLNGPAVRVIDSWANWLMRPGRNGMGPYSVEGTIFIPDMVIPVPPAP